MEIHWIINQLTNINIPTILLSFAGSWGARELVDWVKQRNLQALQANMQKELQSQKAEIDRELEITKTQFQKELQTQYLQAQLKISSLFKAYPELHWAFKETEGAVYQLFYHSFQTQSETHKVWCALTKKLAEHSLFLPDNLKEACVAAKDTLMSGIQSHDSMNTEAKDLFMTDIHKKIDFVTGMMSAHLLKECE
jgi:hypothetical protein